MAARRRPRPALRPARAAERPDRPGPARRRLPGLDPRQGPRPGRPPRRPRRPRRRRSGPPSRRWSPLHLKKHGGDAEKSLAAIPAGRSTRESLARLGDPDLEATLAHVGPASTRAGRRRRPHRQLRRRHGHLRRPAVPRPPARTPAAAWARSSWPSTRELHREVALKQILDHHADDPASRQRFLLEAEITGGLEHPGIVPVYGLGTYGDGRPYYAMRFIRGDSLKEAIERFHADEALKDDPGRRSLELRKLLRRFLDVCNAIDYAHSRGRPAPRHQAGQRHRRQARRDAGGRLGPGQGRWAGPSPGRRASGRWCPARPAAAPRRCPAARWARRPT